jgi:hypothetical protein
MGVVVRANLPFEILASPAISGSRWCAELAVHRHRLVADISDQAAKTLVCLIVSAAYLP